VANGGWSAVKKIAFLIIFYFCGINCVWSKKETIVPSNHERPIMGFRLMTHRARNSLFGHTI
jgi:hypothetical protein